MAGEKPLPDAEALLGKLQALRRRLAEYGGDTPDLDDALTDLSSVAEELGAADELLRTQSAEVAESRRAAEDQRRRYQDLFDFAPDAYVTTDAHGVIHEANRAAAEMFGVEQSDLTGKPLTDYVADADRKTLDCLAVGWTGGTDLRRSELTLAARDGLASSVAVTVTPVRDPRSEVTGLRWMLRDVTERRRREEEFRALVTHSPDPVARIDTQGRFLYANPAAEQIHGVLAKRMLGRTMRQVGAPRRVAERWEEALTRVLSTRQEHAFEFRLPAEGGGRLFQTRLCPEVGPHGEIVTLLAVSRDVTVLHDALERAETAEHDAARALADSEDTRRRLETLLRTIPSGVLVVGHPDARILYVNERARSLYGADPSGLGMATYQERIRLLAADSSPFPPERLPASRALLAGEEVWDEEVLIEHAGGTRYVVRVNAAPVRDVAGRIVAAVASFEDVSDLKETEAALQAARDGMEEEVARRTSELAETNMALKSEVTRRKRAEAGLRETSELLQRIFDTTDLLVAYMDTGLTFVRVNRAYAEAEGRRPDDFLGRTYADLYTDAEDEAVFRRVLETGRPRRISEKLVAAGPKRGWKYCDWSIHPVFDAKGTVNGVLLVRLDVTERVRAREALEAERRRLFDLLNVLPGFITLIDPSEHTVRFVNEQFVETVGKPGNKPCYELFLGRDRPCPDCFCARVLAAGRASEWESALPDGRTFHLWVYPFRDTDGTRLVLEYGLDVTEEKRLRAQVVAAAEEERQSLGREMHDSLGQDLTALAYVAENLAKSLTAEKSPHAGRANTLADLARNAGEKAHNVARGLAPVDLSEEGLLEALRDLLDETREVYGIPCVLECPDPVAVRDIAVATDLYRIAQEALHNAVRHAEPRRVRLRLGCRDGSLTLAVEDDGKGLPEEPEVAGGMGLRVMAYRARRIGGRLEVGSRSEGGTRVACVLPRFREEGPHEEAGHEPQDG